MLKGLPVCRGLAHGRGRWVEDWTYGFSIQCGDVLVTRFPLLALVPILRHASALVCGYGGRTAGLFVMARTYAIPVVLGLGSQLERMAEDDVVWVDGSSGMLSNFRPCDASPSQGATQASAHLP